MFGIDVSHHQDPKTLAWDDFAGAVDFVIARACYGAELRDRCVVEHVRRGRAIGAKVGLYIFYRPSQPVEKQYDLFRSVADLVHLGAGDIVPCVDIEDDPFPTATPVTRAWNAPVLELVHKLDAAFGVKCMPYLNESDWIDLGEPAWLLERDRPLWIANYTKAPSPKVPRGRAWNIWQHRVSVFDPSGEGGLDKAKERRVLDQNRANGLPLLGLAPARAAAPVETTGEDDRDWDELRDEVAARQIPWFDLIDFKAG